MKMETAGQKLATVFTTITADFLKPGVTTLEIEELVVAGLAREGLLSRCKGYMGYKHVSCISVNDEVVHGIPSKEKKLKSGDLVTVDVCASWQGYCADMARCFFVGKGAPEMEKLAQVAQQSLDKGIAQACAGRRLTDISAAVQREVESNGFGVVRDFAGHGIGKSMHEDPEVLNYGQPGRGPVLQVGMALAIEPMITAGAYDVYVADDGWTVLTEDQSWAAHVEDTVLITQNGPKILTRL